MTKFIIDSHAWIEYMLSTDKGAHVKEIIENKNNSICTHILCLAEISSRLQRSGIVPDDAIRSIISVSEIIYMSNDDALHAGKLHSEIRKNIHDFGLVDAFILLTAKNTGMKILTGDQHFRTMKEAILL